MSNLRPQAYGVTLVTVTADGLTGMVEFPPVDNVMAHRISPRSGATIYFMGSTFPPGITQGFGVPSTGLRIEGNARFWLGAEGGASTGLVEVIQERTSI